MRCALALVFVLTSAALSPDVRAATPETAVPEVSRPAPPPPPKPAVPPFPWLNPDGSIKQSAVVDAQRRLLAWYNELLGLKLRLSETEHFLFFSELDPSTVAQFQELGESAYKNAVSQMGIPPDDPIWDGKCVVVLLRSKEEMAQAENAFGRPWMDVEEGGFVCTHYEGGGPKPSYAWTARRIRLHVMAEGVDEATLRESFRNRVILRIIEMYLRGEDSPDWLFWGLHNCLRAVDMPARKDYYWRIVMPTAAESGVPAQLVEGNHPARTTEEVCFAAEIVDYLITAGPAKFNRLLCQMRVLAQGRSLRNEHFGLALKEAYGFDPAELVRLWRNHAAELLKRQAPSASTPTIVIDLRLPNPPRSLTLDRTGFVVPRTCLNVDGAVNQDLVAEGQKKRLDVINRSLNMRLALSETPHFLIFSESNTAVTAEFVKGCELLYWNLCDQFGLDRKERVWDGKCILLLFEGRPGFSAYAERFDGLAVDGVRGYCSWEMRRPVQTMPQLVHISLFLQGNPPREMRGIFAHECTHAFLDLFVRGERLPRWLDEGLAMYMMTINDPALASDYWSRAKAVNSPGYSPSALLGDKSFKTPTWDDYTVAYTLVDCLLKGGGAQKFRQMLVLLKEGKDPDTALKKVFGYDSTGFAKYWNAYMARARPPKPR
jgi:hypothetical protein